MEYSEKLAELEHAFEGFFGKKIKVSTRASAAFIEAYTYYEVFNMPVFFMNEYDWFVNIIVNSPACADILTRKGIPIESIVKHVSARPGLKRGLNLCNYKAMFHDIFEYEFPYQSGLSLIGQKVMNTGVLAESDVFTGILEAARCRILPNKTGKEILLLAGVSDDGYVDEYGEEFLQSIELACSSIIDMDPSHFNQQFILYLDENNKARLRPFGATTLGSLETPAFLDQPFLFRGGILQPLSSARIYSLDLIEQLEDMTNSTQCSEHDFQVFFEKYPQLLTGLDFSKAHPQPILYKDHGGRLIPDFFLEKIDCGWDAIVDLKKPYDTMVVRKNNRVYFKQWVQEAIAQLQYYREWFDSHRNRKSFEESLQISKHVFRPKMVVVAGRSSHFLDDVERIRLLTNQDKDIELWTYDDLVNRAKRYNQFLYSAG